MKLKQSLLHWYSNMMAFSDFLLLIQYWLCPICVSTRLPLIKMSLISCKMDILIFDSALHSRMKCSIFPSPSSHKRRLGSILYRLNDDQFTWRICVPVTSFSLIRILKYCRINKKREKSTLSASIHVILSWTFRYAGRKRCSIFWQKFQPDVFAVFFCN